MEEGTSLVWRKSKISMQEGREVQGKSVIRLIPNIVYYWWVELREIVDPDRGHEYILWNDKKILIEGKIVFYRHYFDNGVIFTKDLLYDKTNTESFRIMKEQGLTNSTFLVWTGLRQSVPSKLRVNIQNFKTVIDLENYKCKNYNTHLIKFIYEKPRKWD